VAKITDPAFGSGYDERRIEEQRQAPRSTEVKFQAPARSQVETGAVVAGRAVVDLAQ
jgi:hypothetical protein